MSEEETARFRRIAEQFAVTGPFTDPDDHERELWRAGKLIPWYITALLDHGGHVGPQVDLACHAQEPEVDRWEAGQLYPTWDQTVALARLLDVRVRDLTHPEAAPRHHADRPARRLHGVAILSFEPAAVDAAI